ncbi:MAG: hypothetical protein K2Y05_03665 [Hyphomicrobiaceae bacterium]|nr:hypothetical protein [Hyphomicrobiaceae bacterium]
MSGMPDEVHDKDRKLDADLKGKLDFFLWHQRFKAGYQAWSRAHTDKKAALLLTGPSLSVAEGWLLLHPSKFSDGERRFIMRSVAQSTQKAVTTEASEVRRNRSGRSMLIPLLAAGLVVGLIALPRFLAGPKGMTEPATDQVAEAPTAGSPGSSPAGPNEPSQTGQRSTTDNSGIAAAEGGSDGAPPRTAGTAAAPTDSAGDPQASRPSAARLQLAAANIRKLAALSDQKLSTGDGRGGLMLAVEALHRVASLQPGKLRDDSVLPAASAVHRALATTAPLGIRPADTMAMPSAMFCQGGARAVVANPAQGIVSIAIHQPSAAPDRSPELLGKAGAPGKVAAESHLLSGAAVDASCSRIVLPRSDDTAEVVSLTTGQRITAFAGHDADVTVAAFSADGRTIASGSLDATVRLWDASSGRLRKTLAGHEGTIHALAVDPMGRLVASASADRTVRIWNTVTGREFARFDGYNGAVLGVVFNGDGSRVLAYGDGAVHVHDVGAPEKSIVLRAPGRTLLSGQFAPDGDRIAVIADDGSAVVFDAASREPAFELTRPPAEARGIAWSRDGRQLLSYGWGGDVTLHDASTGHGYAILTGPETRAVAAQFSQDGSHVISILDTGTLLTVPVFATLADAARSAAQAAGGCLDDAELALLKTGPPSKACTGGETAAMTAQPWLVAATPKRPEVRRGHIEVDLTSGPIAAAATER